MLRIAIVEDEKTEAQLLGEYLERFGAENGEPCEVTYFYDCLLFLDGYDHKYDAVFMDIEMPSIDGMEASRRLRKLDCAVPLVFVTNMKQYAIDGYSVTALDFILKPVNYFRLSAVMKKVVRLAREHDSFKMVKTNDGTVKIRLGGIAYIEVFGRDITYHTEDGVYSTHGNISALEHELKDHGFLRCHRCYLVNLKHIKKIDKTTLMLTDGVEISLSRYKRKNLLAAMCEIFGDS